MRCGAAIWSSLFFVVVGRECRLVSPGRIVIALLVFGQELFLDLTNIRLPDQSAEIGPAPLAALVCGVPFLERRRAAVAEIVENLPRRLQAGRRGDHRIER